MKIICYIQGVDEWDVAVASIWRIYGKQWWINSIRWLALSSIRSLPLCDRWTFSTSELCLFDGVGRDGWGVGRPTSLHYRRLIYVRLIYQIWQAFEFHGYMGFQLQFWLQHRTSKFISPSPAQYFIIIEPVLLFKLEWFTAVNKH